MRSSLLLVLTSLWLTPLLATPYPDPSKVPVDATDTESAKTVTAPAAKVVHSVANGLPVLRIRIDYDSSSKVYTLGDLVLEYSGTPALSKRARSDDPFGSFRAELIDPVSNKRIYLATQGTGYYFRELSRSFNFRFPMINKPMLLRFTAEDASSGVMTTIIEETIRPTDITEVSAPVAEVRSLKVSNHENPLVINVYAEGYLAARKSQFWIDAAKVVTSLSSSNFPEVDRFTINAVWGESMQAIGSAQNLGSTIPERDSFLGLYFPYWSTMMRWYHVVYPTRTERYRRALAIHPYDYPLAIVDSSTYWGVGNFNELTAVPARNASFTYLLLHEFGHFFGLNEEYESGGPTELAFAPKISEPWSQNITFAKERSKVKWNKHIAATTPVPTPHNQGSGQRIGLYTGGYAETPRPSTAYKPATQCTMNNSGGFCAVCIEALTYRLRLDAGEFAPPPEIDEDIELGSCECARDLNTDACTLMKNNKALAWTYLEPNQTCDETFCKSGFAFQRAIHCNN